MEKKESTRRNCFANATRKVVNVNGRMKQTRKSVRIVFVLNHFFRIDQWEKGAEYEILKRQNIKNGNVLVTLLKSQPEAMISQLEEILVVVKKLFHQEMVAHVFSLFMEAVVMVLVSHMIKVWDILWMLLVIISNLFLHLPHKMVFGWEIHQDRVNWLILVI